MDIKHGAPCGFEDKALSAAADVVTVSGWASTFDDVDEQNDLVCRGVFEKSLATYGMPLLLWQHRIDDVLIGCVVECREERKGLWVQAEMPVEDSFGKTRLTPALRRRSVKAFFRSATGRSKPSGIETVCGCSNKCDCMR